MTPFMFYQLNRLVGRRARLGLIMGLLLLVLAACGREPQPATSTLNEEQATAIGTAAMAGFARGDYAAYTKHWSAAMKSAISEADFLAFREQVLAENGNYVSISSVEMVPGQSAGVVRWVFTCTFEKATMQFAFAFEDGGDEIIGAFADKVAQSN